MGGGCSRVGRFESVWVGVVMRLDSDCIQQAISVCRCYVLVTTRRCVSVCASGKHAFFLLLCFLFTTAEALFHVELNVLFGQAHLSVCFSLGLGQMLGHCFVQTYPYSIHQRATMGSRSVALARPSWAEATRREIHFIFLPATRSVDSATLSTGSVKSVKFHEVWLNTYL